MTREECWSSGPGSLGRGSLVRVGSSLAALSSVYSLSRDDGLHRDAGTAVEVVERLEGERPEARVGLDDAEIQPSMMPWTAPLRAVDRDDLDVAGLLARGLERGDRAERHLVVVGVDAVDVRVRRR